jgi:nitrous oxidase accessory protein
MNRHRVISEQRPYSRSDGLWLVATVIAVILLLSTPRTATGQELIVGPGERLTSIASALELARAGDTVRVRHGTYREGTLTIATPLTLLGDGYPVLDGEGEHAVLVVTADDVEIRGFDIRNAGVSYVRDNAAIRFDGVSNCVVGDNRLTDNFFGIYLARARNCRITNNRISASGTREASSGNGIHLWNSAHVLIEGQPDERASGRDLPGVCGRHHAARKSERGQSPLRSALHVLQRHGLHRQRVPTQWRWRGGHVHANGVTMIDNLFEDNWGPRVRPPAQGDHGQRDLRATSSARNTVGLYAEGSSRIRVAHNRFERNGWAVRIMANSQDNRFTDNDFIDNCSR